MTKKFTVDCDFGGKKVPVTFYVGEPNEESHPINFQSKWLGQEKGGQVPAEVMDSLEKLHELSLKNKVPFEDLCYYAMKEANASKKLNAPQKEAPKAVEKAAKPAPEAAPAKAEPEAPAAEAALETPPATAPTMAQATAPQETPQQ